MRASERKNEEGKKEENRQRRRRRRRKRQRRRRKRRLRESERERERARERKERKRKKGTIIHRRRKNKQQQQILISSCLPISLHFYHTQHQMEEVEIIHRRFTQRDPTFPKQAWFPLSLHSFVAHPLPFCMILGSLNTHTHTHTHPHTHGLS